MCRCRWTGSPPDQTCGRQSRWGRRRTPLHLDGRQPARQPDRCRRAPSTGRQCWRRGHRQAHLGSRCRPWGGTPWPGVPSVVVTHRASPDLLGELRLHLVPLLLGAGTPLFDGGAGRTDPSSQARDRDPPTLPSPVLRTALPGVASPANPAAFSSAHEFHGHRRSIRGQQSIRGGPRWPRCSPT
jgi:hypothetical protein